MKIKNITFEQKTGTMKKFIYTIVLIMIFSLGNTSYSQQIAGGRAFSLAVCDSHAVQAWGYNANGQLGNGTTIDSNIPVEVTGITGAISVSCGDRHSLCLKNDGIVWAWGDNSNGALGNGTNTNSSVPVPVTSLSGITAIAGGRYHSLALKK